jgi:bacterioferritin-associated ferredoxin
MRKIVIVISLISLLIAPVVLGQVQQMQTGQQAGTGEQVQAGEQTQTEQQTQNQGEEQNLMIQQRVQVEAQRISEIKETVQQKAQELSQEMQQLGKTEQSVYQNQNEVRLAVYSLLVMEDILGGIGQQVSQVATEFNNSVQATIKAEEAIQSRNRIVKFFVGGDEEVTEEIEQEINKNQERIQYLLTLGEQCDCGEEVKSMLQEQIANIGQEQNRLQQLVQSEKQIKGIFGWLFGWLRK